MPSTELATLLIDTFAHMIFSTGFVHCDPHPGNLLARPMPAGADSVSTTGGSAASATTALRRPQLVLLDHGMCA